MHVHGYIGPTDSDTQKLGARTDKMFLPLCTQSLGLALVSVISPLSFILRLNNSAHFGKQIQCQDNAYACFYLRFTETSPCDVHESNVEIKVMRILRGYI